MSFIGNTPAEAYSPVVKDTFSGNDSTTDFTLSIPATTNSVEVFVENVQQEPTDAYTIAGTTLSFTAAPVTGTDNIYVIHRGPAVQQVVPPAGVAIDASTVTASGDVSIADKIVHTGDTNTAIRFPAADTVTVETGGSERVRVDSSGNVGIGTSSPSSTLHTSVSSGANKLIIQNTAASQQSVVQINTDSTTPGQCQIYMGKTSAPTNGQVGYDPNSDYLYFYTNNTEVARIDSSANLKFNSGYGSVATAYGCRAWVNFNGTGTVAIRESGNVSSITDNGTGDYTINFSTSMPDANYSANANATKLSNFNSFQAYVVEYGTKATGSFRIGTNADRGGSREDVEFADVAIFR